MASFLSLKPLFAKFQESTDPAGPLPTTKKSHSIIFYSSLSALIALPGEKV